MVSVGLDSEPSTTDRAMPVTHCSFHGSGNWRSQVKVLAGLVSLEASLPSSPVAVFSSVTL